MSPMVKHEMVVPMNAYMHTLPTFRIKLWVVRTLGAGVLASGQTGMSGVKYLHHPNAARHNRHGLLHARPAPWNTKTRRHCTPSCACKGPRLHRQASCLPLIRPQAPRPASRPPLPIPPSPMLTIVYPGCIQHQT